MNWETVIGLEVHVQLATESKLFSGASTAFGAAPNTQACALDLGLPGTLPVLNARAVLLAIRFGLAVGAEIARETSFDRKHYFYPDLPKGYQISQLAQPIVGTGTLSVAMPDGLDRDITIVRAHLEEDAGKSLHEDFHGMTSLDLNRAGAPLLEIVTAPDLRSPADAGACLRAIHRLVRYLQISDANMEEGSLRCDANVSVRPAGQSALGERVEIKNLNSFRFMERALAHEVERHVTVLENGGSIDRETRLYDPERDETRPTRTKEQLDDYRYFADPDLLPLQIEDVLLDEIRADLPEALADRTLRYRRELGLTDSTISYLLDDPAAMEYFDAVVAYGGKPVQAAHWIMGDLAAVLRRRGISINQAPMDPRCLAELIRHVESGALSGKQAKIVFNDLSNGANNVADVITKRGLRQLHDNETLTTLVADTIARHSEQVAQYQAGKKKVFGFFVGQIMKATGGNANPRLVNELLRAHLHAE